MLLFVQSISCLYFFHKRTQRFLGEVTPSESKVRFTAYNHPEPIGLLERAIDFRIGHTNDSTGLTVTIEHPTNGQTLDSQSGMDKIGLPLIFYLIHRLGAQQFQIILLADNSIVIGYKGKCLKYDEVTNGFFTSKCEGLKDSTFDIYYEVPPTPEYYKEQVYNLDNKENVSPDNKKYEFIKSTNPFINGPDGHLITEITFENGKAIAKTPIDKDITDMKLEHAPIRIRKEKRPLRHISRGNGRRGHKDSSDSSSDRSSKKRRCRAAGLVSGLCADSSSSSDNYSYSSDSDLQETHKRVRRERLLHGKPTKSHGMVKVARDGIYV